MVNVFTAPGKRSLSDFSPGTVGMQRKSSAKVRYISWASSTSAIADASDSWAVCPSCHRNSVVLRKTRGRISHRTTLHHWLRRIGKSRYDWIHSAMDFPKIVSEV